MQIAIGFLFAVLCLLLSSSNSKLAKINVTSDEDLVFLKYTVQTIQDPNAFAHFGGHEIKAWLGNKATNSIVIDESKEAGLRSWKEILEAMQTSKQVTESQTAQIQALHVHNEHKIGDLFEKMQRYIRNYKKGKKKLEKLDSQDIHDVVNKAPYPFVMTNSGDENWGFLSTNIGTRTTKWINMTNHLRIHRADHQSILDFLGAEKLLLLICNTHVDPAIGAHRKVLSLPLGVKGGPKLYKRMKQIIQKKGNQRKTKLLVINNSGWGDRTKINAQVIEAFNHTVSNSYKQNNGEFVDHYEETAMAKFVLCPSGLGMDSYRLWETVGTLSIFICGILYFYFFMYFFVSFRFF